MEDTQGKGLDFQRRVLNSLTCTSSSKRGTNTKKRKQPMLQMIKEKKQDTKEKMNLGTISQLPFLGRMIIENKRSREVSSRRKKRASTSRHPLMMIVNGRSRRQRRTFFPFLWPDSLIPEAPLLFSSTSASLVLWPPFARETSTAVKVSWTRTPLHMGAEIAKGNQEEKEKAGLGRKSRRDTTSRTTEYPEVLGLAS